MIRENTQNLEKYYKTLLNVTEYYVNENNNVRWFCKLKILNQKKLTNDRSALNGYLEYPFEEIYFFKKDTALPCFTSVIN